MCPRRNNRVLWIIVFDDMSLHEWIYVYELVDEYEISDLDSEVEYIYEVVSVMKHKMTMIFGPIFCSWWEQLHMMTNWFN